MAKRIIGLVIALLMICAILVPITFVCIKEEERYTIEEIEEYVQRTFFDKNGNLSEVWDYGGEIIEMDDGYCYNTLYPQYVFEKPTSFEITLLKDVKNPEEYNYFLVEFNTSGYFVGPLIKSYNWTYLDDGFRIWPSPYKLLNIAPEDRYMYMKKGIRYKTCATIIDGEMVNISGEPLDDGSGFAISPTQSICAYYSSKIDDWIRYDATTDESGLYDIYGTEEQQKKRLNRIVKEAERNPIDFQKINEEMDWLISGTNYNLKRL